jgi:hypothetical protein
MRVCKFRLGTIFSNFELNGCRSRRDANSHSFHRREGTSVPKPYIIMSRFLTTIIYRGLATTTPHTFVGSRRTAKTRALLQPVRVAAEPSTQRHDAVPAAGARGHQVPSVRALPIQDPSLSRATKAGISKTREACVALSRKSGRANWTFGHDASEHPSSPRKTS